ncbi:hypothetical protein F5890DRAFT_1506776 [Lentinula detonsa]|uniref:Uncharacterized protein n=1 Tax=Lentinula detonsa TaxID=2804962 RepID=A0AA38Q2J9_9AGAR|nr:hypothetical protein F5890DRAFT_1506776 [Lentinula detonsa]
MTQRDSSQFRPRYTRVHLAHLHVVLFFVSFLMPFFQASSSSHTITYGTLPYENFESSLIVHLFWSRSRSVFPDTCQLYLRPSQKYSTRSFQG